MSPLHEISACDDLQETCFGILVETAGLKPCQRYLKFLHLWELR
jgi:hypothetical protein